MSSDDNNPQHPSPRDYLRHAVMQLDAAHASQLDAPDTRGKALTGRWTLLDEFEAGGKQYVLAAADVGAKPPSPQRLTSREKQVLALAASGLTNKEIAFELGVTATTVRVLIARAANRLGVVGRNAVVAAFRVDAPDDHAAEQRTAFA